MMLQTVHSANKKIPAAELFLPWRIVRHLFRHRELIAQLTKRDIQSRYRGSYLGVLWSLLRPLSMLAVFTVVFGFIFGAKLGHHPDESRLDFALALFCGLITFDFLAQCVSRAPGLIRSNPNYVSKVVFPLEILPVATVAAALTHLGISAAVLLGGLWLAHGTVPLTALYFALLALPLALLCLGLTWLLSALGVFLRDIEAVVPVALMILMYASAIFYPINRVPPQFMPIVQFNPLAVLIEQARNAVLWATPPAPLPLLATLGFSLLLAIGGYAFFMRTKRAFPDVL